MRKTFARLVTTSFLMLVFSHSIAQAREKVLYQFPGGVRGNDPQNGVVFDSKGNAYGATLYGGTYGWGTVFRLTQSNHGWVENVLYSFRGGSDGFNPSGNLVIDAAGNLYGTTLGGGASTECQQDSYDCGTVFQLAQANGEWKHVVIYSFCSRDACQDGSNPIGLTLDTAGNLFGTTATGGPTCYENGCGTVYELSPSHGSWKEKVLHAFNPNNDGYYPTPGVTMDTSGTLYGTTYAGGGYGYGTVFAVTPSKGKWKEVVVFAFDGSTNNRDANGYLTIDSAGNIFGTTRGDDEGCTYQCGSVFRLSRSKGQWVESNVYVFDGTHGDNPNPGLILDADGNFYGTTYTGGANNFGEVFELKPGKTWKIRLLYSFTGEGGNEYPNPGLIFGPDGNLYGTAPTPSYDGQYDGEVFEVLH